MDRIDVAVTWALAKANDDSHGYDQNTRWGPSYDCSSLVISAWEQAGVPIKSAGGTVTGNMRRAFQACGFQVVPFTGSGALKRGDVLLNERHHTAMYLGDGRVVHASINEKGMITGGAPGDQTGKEICVRSFYTPSHGWDCVLRYAGEGSSSNTSKEDKKVRVSLTQCRKGSKCAEVGVLQTLLNALGYKGVEGKDLVVDCDFGSNTDHAVQAFQSEYRLVVDKIVGEATWSKLLTANYKR